MAKLVERPWMAEDGTLFKTETEARKRDEEIKVERDIAARTKDIPELDERLTLKEWKIQIDYLLSKYPEDSVLYSDAGHNNVSFYLEIPKY